MLRVYDLHACTWHKLIEMDVSCMHSTTYIYYVDMHGPLVSIITAGVQLRQDNQGTN